MEAYAKSFSFLKNEHIVKIPFFQRRYVWKEENWDEILHELMGFEKEHFLGSLILRHELKNSGNVSSLSVIDGQQRLTTLCILLKALYDSLDKDNKENARDVFNACLYYKKSPLDAEKYVKIEHSKNDKKSYASVIENQVKIEDITEKSNQILKCYKHYVEKLKSYDIDSRRILFKNLVDDEHKIFVIIDIEDKDNEQTIFDTINSSGVRLSSADIIKNTLFQRAKELFDDNTLNEMYTECWEKIFNENDETSKYWDTARSTGRLMRDNIEILLHSIAVISGFFDPEKHVLSDLAKHYKEKIKGLGKDDLKSFIKDIAEYANIFKDKMGRAKNFTYENYEARLLQILDVCEVSTFHPYILKIFKEHGNDNEFIKAAFSKLEKLVIRRMISGNTVKSYNKWCKAYINDDTEIDKHIAETSNDKVCYGLSNIKNSNATLVLFWIELFRIHSDPKYDTKELAYTYSLEHIMPQGWEKSKEWIIIPVLDKDGKQIDDAEEARKTRNNQVYSIGNMTLLTRNLNSSLKNNSFECKINGYGNKKGIKEYSKLSITSLDIVEPFDNGDRLWNEAKIIARTQKLANEVLKIWGS